MSKKKKTNEKNEKNEKVEKVEKGNPEITKLINKLGELSKEEVEDKDSAAMLTFTLGKNGIYMGMIGQGKDVAVMVATAMSSQPMIAASITNAAMMFRMRQQEVVNGTQDTTLSDAEIVEVADKIKEVKTKNKA